MIVSGAGRVGESTLGTVDNLVSRLSIRKVSVITTMSTPADVYRDSFNNSIDGWLIEGTFRQIGIEDIRCISLNGVKQASQEQRVTWLDETYQQFAGGNL